MLESRDDVISRLIWLVSVLGAAAVMVGPITLGPVEALGLGTCLAATTALCLRFVRR
jgi:hypothetical protein